MTDAEQFLWYKIKKKQKNDLQFYRQKPLGNYIVDFYCPKTKLVIEVDGSQHYTKKNMEYDKIRDGYLNNLDLEIQDSTISMY